jgi:hypothetical protein
MQSRQEESSEQALRRFAVCNTLSRLGAPCILPPTVEKSCTKANFMASDIPHVMNCLQEENGITEFVMEVETLNGIPVPAMIFLIKCETMVASLYGAVRVHHRATSMYGSLPIETIFKPVVSGCMCKGICHSVDVPGCVRILANCISRAQFVHHSCVPFFYVQLLKCFSQCQATYEATIFNESSRLSAMHRIEKFLRMLNHSMYNWKGYVMKPLPVHAPYSLYDMDIGAARESSSTHEEEDHISSCHRRSICSFLSSSWGLTHNATTDALVSKRDQEDTRIC